MARHQALPFERWRDDHKLEMAFRPRRDIVRITLVDDVEMDGLQSAHNKIVDLFSYSHVGKIPLDSRAV